MLGEIAAAAAKTDTFLGERYRRIVKRRGKLKALVAVARTILFAMRHRIDPLPDLFGSAAHKEAVARLRWLISARGLGYLPAKSAPGKTMAR